MKNLHPLAKARRRDRRLEKLGWDHPFCYHCGCLEPMLLRPVTKSFLEEHHVVGRAHDSQLTLALCFNCHALATENLLSAGVNMEPEPEPNPLKFARMVFRAFAVHFQMLSDAFWRFEKMLGQIEETR